MGPREATGALRRPDAHECILSSLALHAISLVFVVLVAAVAGAGCRAAIRAPIVQPGVPGGASRQVSVAEATDLSGIRHTAADAGFMQAMIGHHAQAVEMTALVVSRTQRDDIRLLAERIADSQADEIALMRAWLEARGEVAPDEHAHHAPGAAPMAGMLTAAEMAWLGDATGPTFDQLFLELMIKHHEGALTMAHALFATDGAGQEPEIFAFASDVIADQEIEIRRMKGMMHAP